MAEAYKLLKLLSIQLLLGAMVSLCPGLLTAQEASHKIDFTEADKNKFLQIYSSFLLGELMANRFDIEHSIACFEQGSNSLDSSCKAVLLKAPNYISAFQDMRLNLALSKPERWSNHDNPRIIEGTKPEQYLTDKMTLRLKHLFGKLEISMFMDVPLKEELQALSEEEIQQALVLWEIDTMAADKKFEERESQMAEVLKTNKIKTVNTRILQQERLAKLDRQLKFRLSLRRKAYETHKELYIEQIKRYPLVIFMSAPEKPKSQWKNPDRPEFISKTEAWYPTLAKALKSAHSLNEELITMVSEARAKSDCPSLLALVGFKKSLDKYLTTVEDLKEFRTVQSLDEKKYLAPEVQQQIAAQLLNEFDDAEFYQDMKYVAGLLMTGVMCMVGPSKLAKLPGVKTVVNKAIKTGLAKYPKTAGFLACTIGTGIVANAFFYNITLGRYQQTYRQIFATPGGNIVLQEFSDFHGRDTELLFESAFYFVGTGIPEFFKKLTTLAMNILKGAIH